MAVVVQSLFRLSNSSDLASGSGLYSFTAAGMGTPKAAIVFLMPRSTSASAMSQISVGVTDGTNQYCFSTKAKNGVATSDACCVHRNDSVAYAFDTTGSGGTRLEFSQWIADGVELELMATPGDGSYIAIVMLIGGTGVQAQVRTLDITAGGPVDDVLSIDPDILIGFGGIDSTVNTVQTDFGTANLWMAVLNADTSVTNGCSATYYDSGVADSTTRSRRQHYSDRIISSLTNADPDTPNGFVSVSDIVGDTVTFDATFATVDETVYYLALEMPAGVDFKLNSSLVDAAATGTDVRTWPGFEAGALLSFHSSNTTANALEEHTSFGFGMTDQRSMFTGAARHRGSFSPVAANSRTDNTFMYWVHDGRLNVAAYRATFNDEDASGYELSWATVDGSNDRYFLELAIEEEVAIVSPSSIGSAEAWGTPTLAAGAVTISPSSIGSAEAWGDATITATVTLSPTGIASAEMWGDPVLVAGVVVVSPTGIGSAEAWGDPTLTPGAVTISPSSIGSAEAWGTPTLAAGAVTISPSSIGSSEAWGDPVVSSGLVVSPSSIDSAEAWGDPVLVLGAAVVSPSGIASAEAWGLATLSTAGQQTVIPSGIISAEAWGHPFLAGGFIPVSLKKKVQDALCAAAQQGTFLAVQYDSENCVMLEGPQISPASIETNELSSGFQVDPRHRRAFVQDFSRWEWSLILRFNQEANCEPWVRSLLDSPICLPREPGETRQVRLLLLDAKYEHPPREGASNGTTARYRFAAEPSAR